MQKRKRLPLTPEEENSLKQLYLYHRIPVDQYRRRTAFAEKFLATWNAASGRSDSAGEIIHFMMTRRKQGRWPRFDGHHLRLKPKASDAGLTPAAWEIIREEYRLLGIGSDNFQFSPDLLTSLRARLLSELGINISAMALAAAIMDCRKDGNLGKLDPRDEGDDIGFSDIDKVA